MSVVDEAVAAIRAGELVVIPTDTVYGLCADAYDEAAAGRLSQLKGRPETQPLALLAADLGAILDAVPELHGQPALRAGALLPGPYTLVLPNPARRFGWLCGTNPEAIGIRIPDLPPDSRAVLDCVGAVASTSANRHGERDPARVQDIPDEIRTQAVVIDAGELPGTPSTVLDLTGPEPAVLRVGAVPAAEALARLAAA